MTNPVHDSFDLPASLDGQDRRIDQSLFKKDRTGDALWISKRRNTRSPILPSVTGLGMIENV